MNEAELVVLDAIAEHMRNGFMDFIMPKITLLGDGGVFWILVAVGLLLFKRTRKTGLMMGTALLLGLLFCNLLLKPMVARVRPYDVKGILPYLCAVQHDYSFPSGHTTASFEAATVLFIRHRKWGIAALVLAALIAFSRMYLYVHYPTDILVGLVLGVVFGILGVLIVEQLDKRRRQKQHRLPQAH